MNFFADHNVYGVTVRFLRDLGHDVVTAADRAMSGATDDNLLAAAEAEGRVFVTRDRDFGWLVFVRSLGGGVIYLRVLPATVPAVHSELGRVLGLYNASELAESFVVVEPGRHRIRRPPGTTKS